MPHSRQGPIDPTRSPLTAAGDGGVTFGLGGNPGADHIYLILTCGDKDEVMIADNQVRTSHERLASDLGGKTPTDYLLRARRFSSSTTLVHSTTLAIETKDLPSF
jgi:hypothetical protein